LGGDSSSDEEDYSFTFDIAFLGGGLYLKLLLRLFYILKGLSSSDELDDF
jgi:hypothetical protein